MTGAVRAGGHRLHYIEAGGGAPLLLVHGLGGSGRWWSPLFPALTSSGLRVIAPDLPGFGRSEGPPRAADVAARILLELMDRLGIPRFSVAGHSMGGAIAVSLAARFGGRVDRLILMDSVGIPERQALRAIGQALRPWRWSSARILPWLVSDILRAGPRSLWWSSRQLLDQDVRPLLPRVRAPTLLIWGARDGLIPPEHAARFAAALPDARIVLIPRARHVPMVTEPARTARSMIEFLSMG